MMLRETLEDRLLIEESDRSAPPVDRAFSQLKQQGATSGKDLQQSGVFTSVELLRPSRDAPGPPVDGQKKILLEADVLRQRIRVSIKSRQRLVSPLPIIRLLIEQRFLVEKEELIQSLVKNLQ